MISHSIFESDLNAKVFSLYDRLRKGSEFPTWQQFQSHALRLPKELPYIYVVDVVEQDGETRFQFRLMGTGLTDILRQEGTGKFVRDLPLGGWENIFRETLLHAYGARRPAIAIDVLKHTNGLEISLEHMALPLADDGNEISHIVGAVDFLGYSQDDIATLGEKINWGQINEVEVPKRLLISNLAIPV
jgi:hypothetical protein